MSKKEVSNKPIRIHLVDWQSFWLTLGLIIILAAAMVGLHLLGWEMPSKYQIVFRKLNREYTNKFRHRAQ